MNKPQEFVGLVYDWIEEVVIDRSSVIRATAAAALADAKALCRVVNAQAEAIDDSTDENTSVGRCDESYAFVQGPHGIESEDDIADREDRWHSELEQMRAEGRLPGYNDTPSLPAAPGY